MNKANEALDALKTIFAPFIKEVVLATLEESQQSQQAQQTQEVEAAQVTAEETAKMLHVSKVSLWRWEKKGYLVPVKVGRKVFYRQSDINRILQGN